MLKVIRRMLTTRSNPQIVEARPSSTECDVAKQPMQILPEQIASLLKEDQTTFQFVLDWMERRESELQRMTALASRARAERDVYKQQVLALEGDLTASRELVEEFRTEALQNRTELTMFMERVERLEAEAAGRQSELVTIAELVGNQLKEAAAECIDAVERATERMTIGASADLAQGQSVAPVSSERPSVNAGPSFNPPTMETLIA